MECWESSHVCPVPRGGVIRPLRESAVWAARVSWLPARHAVLNVNKRKVGAAWFPEGAAVADTDARGGKLWRYAGTDGLEPAL